MLPSFWVASTKRCKDAGSPHSQSYGGDRGRRNAQRDRGPEAGGHFPEGHEAIVYCSGGWRRRQTGERRYANVAARQAPIRARYDARLSLPRASVRPCVS